MCVCLCLFVFVVVVVYFIFLDCFGVFFSHLTHWVPRWWRSPHSCCEPHTCIDPHPLPWCCWRSTSTTHVCTRSHTWGRLPPASGPRGTWNREHSSDVTWSSWRLKSTRMDSLFNTLFRQTLLALCGGNLPDSPHKGLVTWKRFHDVIKSSIVWQAYCKTGVPRCVSNGVLQFWTKPLI